MNVYIVMLDFALCFVLLKRNKLVIPCFAIPSLAENVGKIINAHPHGPILI